MEIGIFSPRSAALPVTASAVLHLLAFVVEGFTAMAATMLVIGLVYAAIAFGLRKEWRWLAWITLFVMMAGMIAAYANAGTGLHGWWYLVIALIDLIAAILLFGALWRSKPMMH